MKPQVFYRFYSSLALTQKECNFIEVARVSLTHNFGTPKWRILFYERHRQTRMSSSHSGTLSSSQQEAEALHSRRDRCRLIKPHILSFYLLFKYLIHKRYQEHSVVILAHSTIVAFVGHFHNGKIWHQYSRCSF